MVEAGNSTKYGRIIGSRTSIITLLLVVATIIGTLYSVLLFGVTSRAQPTGSITGVRTLIAEDLRLEGVAVSDVTIDASISSVNDHWARFVLTPKSSAPRNIEKTYGYMEFREHRWQLIVIGAASVGCGRGVAVAPKVPEAVIRGFGVLCSSD